MSDITIITPSASTTVKVLKNNRFFIAQGKLEGRRLDLGVTGHLVADNTNNVLAAGKLIAYNRVGTGPEFYWAILFRLNENEDSDDYIADDVKYDLVFTVHHTSKEIVGEAVAEPHPKRVQNVKFQTVEPLVVNIASPLGPGNISANMFLPYGSYTTNKPTTATMTDEADATKVFTAGNLYTNGGSWYAGFSSLTLTHSYTLFVSDGMGSSKTVEHLKAT
jgi:hypothetical protein